jgi:L-ascorbate metabolism protein UlaG (beta-lactamase superfamily)
MRQVSLNAAQHFAQLGLLAMMLIGAYQAGAHELPEGEARYLGNEGVMVSVAGHKVLMDAFYSQSFATYTLVPDRLMADMINGRPPYHDIAAVFISHVHGDHFSVAPLLKFLAAQTEVQVFAPQQVYERLQAADVSADVLARVEAFDLAPGDAPRSVAFAGLEIDVAALPHAGGERMADVRNLIYRVSLDAQHTFMHLGDAAAQRDGFVALESFWAARDVDTAFPPYWFFADPSGRNLIDEFVAADQVIAIHVPAAALGQGDEWRARLEVDLFTDPGEFRRLRHEH